MEDKRKIEGEKYLRAQKKVEKEKEVYVHAVVFVFVMPIIIITNLKFVPRFHYFWFTLFGWGMGVFLHWLVVIGFKSSLFGEDWEARKIKEYMDKDHF
ncbi:MAG: 2TM domain-containing protein [Polaribacter sp.]|nr:2TM domain-containing protein [Polaribacter sp.]